LAGRILYADFAQVLNLLGGNLFPPPFSGGQIGRWFVQRRFVEKALEFHSGERDHHSARRRFVRSASSRNRDRHQPGTLIGIARNTQPKGVKPNYTFGRGVLFLSIGLPDRQCKQGF
jgi:hypothetical protein